jgi:isoleucyl-tRNA synthetase
MHAVRKIQHFVVEDLSNWYLRRSRRRFWGSETTDDKVAVYLTTHTALVTVALLMAPIAPFLSEEIYLNLTDGGVASVHLADFPVADEAAKDADLEERMGLVRDLVSLGRGVREKERLKVRQPLRAVYADGVLEGCIGPMTDLIKDELNVKEVVFLKDTSAYMDYQIKPNFKAAGPVFGKNMKDFAAALASMPAAETAGLAAAFSGGESAKESVTVLVNVGGRDVPVSAELVDIKVSAKEGFAVAMENGNFIIVDTSLDAELIQEGLAREFVSKVQQMRKAAGLEMMDRIEIFYSGDADVAAAVSGEGYGAYIARETLADRVAEDADAAADAADAFDLNGHETKIAIRKVV